MKKWFEIFTLESGQGVSARQAGLARILFFGILLLTTSSDYLLKFTTLDLTLYCQSTMGIWTKINFSPEVSQQLMWIYRISLVTSLTGFLLPISLWVSFLSFFTLNIEALKFCYYNHVYMPVHIALLFWAILGGQSGFRLDQWVFKQRPSSKTFDFLFYAMKAHFCIIFFLSAISKLHYGGWKWLSLESLKNYLVLQNYFFQGVTPHRLFSSFNYELTMYPILCALLAMHVLFIEFIVPVALFKLKWQRTIVLQLLLMQVGIYFLMYINFSAWLCLYVFWLWKQKPFNLNHYIHFWHRRR